LISCKLKQCGLGSQLFQIATTLALAWDNNDEACFDFNTQNMPSQGKRAIQYSHSIYRNLIKVEGIEPHSIFTESSMEYTAIPYKPYMVLDGFFFSDKYFAHHRDRILDLLLPSKHQIIDIFAPSKYTFIDLISELDILAQEFDTCAIHFRHGDYLKYSRYHPVIDIDYYLNAMDMFPSHTRFIIFSDDIEWCKKILIGSRYRFVESGNDLHDLYLMSLCQHQIIANSTFSWWGSWLNQNPNKLVIAPKQWYCGEFKNINIEDLYTDWMVKI